MKLLKFFLNLFFVVNSLFAADCNLAPRSELRSWFDENEALIQKVEQGNNRLFLKKTRELQKTFAVNGDESAGKIKEIDFQKTMARKLFTRATEWVQNDFSVDKVDGMQNLIRTAQKFSHPYLFHPKLVEVQVLRHAKNKDTSSLAASILYERGPVIWDKLSYPEKASLWLEYARFHKIKDFNWENPNHPFHRWISKMHQMHPLYNAIQKIREGQILDDFLLAKLGQLPVTIRKRILNQWEEISWPDIINATKKTNSKSQIDRAKKALQIYPNRSTLNRLKNQWLDSLDPSIRSKILQDAKNAALSFRTWIGTNEPLYSYKTPGDAALLSVLGIPVTALLKINSAEFVDMVSNWINRDYANGIPFPVEGLSLVEKKIFQGQFKLVAAFQVKEGHIFSWKNQLWYPRDFFALAIKKNIRIVKRDCISESVESLEAEFQEMKAFIDQQMSNERFLLNFKHGANREIFTSLFGSNGEALLVTAFANGKNLDQVFMSSDPIYRNKPIAIELALSMAIQLIDWSRIPLVHNDVKGGNIILSPEGVVKVIDFGLASKNSPKIYEKPQNILRGTSGFGTYEKLILGNNYSKSSDIFLLGLTLLQSWQHATASLIKDFREFVNVNLNTVNLNTKDSISEWASLKDWLNANSKMAYWERLLYEGIRWSVQEPALLAMIYADKKTENSPEEKKMGHFLMRIYREWLFTQVDQLQFENEQGNTENMFASLKIKTILKGMLEPDPDLRETSESLLINLLPGKDDFYPPSLPLFETIEAGRLLLAPHYGELSNDQYKILLGRLVPALTRLKSDSKINFFSEEKNQSGEVISLIDNVAIHWKAHPQEKTSDFNDWLMLEIIKTKMIKGSCDHASERFIGQEVKNSGKYCEISLETSFSA